MINHAESLAIAKIVGFDPESELGASHISEARQCHKLRGLNEGEKYKVIFYIALGYFIYCEYIDNGLKVPDFNNKVNNWYLINTEKVSNGIFDNYSIPVVTMVC